MLEEAIEIIRLLWQGEERSYRGRHYTVEDARLYTRPEEPPSLVVAAAAPRATRLAARAGDGLIGDAPDRALVERFREAGGEGKPCYGKLTVSYARTDEEALRTAYAFWPNAALPRGLTQLRTPAEFEDAASLLRPEEVGQAVVCSSDPERHVAAIRSFAEAGFDHVAVHQVGRDQEAFLRFYADGVLPRVADLAPQPARP